MSAVGRPLMVLLVILPLVAAMAAMTVWWLPALCIGAGGLTFLALGTLAAWREEQDPFWTRRRCTACGETASDVAIFCLRCGSADIADQSAHRRRSRPWDAWDRKREDRERSIEMDRRHGVYAPFWKIFGWYVRFMTGGMGMDPDDPADMRWWASMMVLVASLFAALGTASEFGGWTMAFPVLFAALGTSFAIAVFGPRSMSERTGIGVRA